MWEAAAVAAGSCPHLAGAAPEPPVWEWAGGVGLGMGGSRTTLPHSHIADMTAPQQAGMLGSQHDVEIAGQRVGMRAYGHMDMSA